MRRVLRRRSSSAIEASSFTAFHIVATLADRDSANGGMSWISCIFELEVIRSDMQDISCRFAAGAGLAHSKTPRNGGAFWGNDSAAIMRWGLVCQAANQGPPL